VTTKPKLKIEEVEQITKKDYIINGCIAFALTAISCIMSGLTIGLASIDRLALEIEAKLNPENRKKTDKIFYVINQYHWMLVTLILCNSLAQVSLPIFFDKF